MTENAKPRRRKKPDLQTIARDMLIEHKTIAAAVKPFAALIEQNAELRAALATDYLKQVAATAKKTPHSRRRTGPHRRPVSKGPTAEQKAGAMRAERQYVAAVFAHKLRGGNTIGNTRINQLQTIADTSAQNGLTFLRRGYDDIVESFTCTWLSQYSVASDPFALVKDTIKPAIAQAMLDHAKIKAMEFIHAASDREKKELYQLAIAAPPTFEQHP